jgi:hypothetical protein
MKISGNMISLDRDDGCPFASGSDDHRRQGSLTDFTNWRQTLKPDRLECKIMFFRGAFGGQVLMAGVLFALLLSANAGLGQQAASPVAADQHPPDAPLPAPPGTPVPPHRFWDRTNILLFSGIAVFRGLDYASTRNFQARGRTEILLADDVVNNSAAFAGVEAGGTAASVGLSYLLHRTGHHKLERWLSIGHIGVTAFGVGWNYSLKSKHPH